MGQSNPDEDEILFVGLLQKLSPLERAQLKGLMLARIRRRQATMHKFVAPPMPNLTEVRYIGEPPSRGPRLWIFESDPFDRRQLHFVGGPRRRIGEQ